MTTVEASSSGSLLTDKFPALHRLVLGGRRRRIPYVQQTTIADCAAACLTMVLGLHGRAASLSEVREIVGASREGTNALSLLEAARFLNLRGRGVQIEEIEDLRFLERGAVLHWRFNHFVVFDRLEQNAVRIVDPAVGRRRISRAEFDRSSTGVALTFEPDSDFEPRRAGKSAVWRYLDQMRAESGLLTKIIVTSVLLQLIALSVPLVTGLLVDRVVPRGDVDLLRVLAIGLAGLVGFKLLSSLIRSFLLLHLRTRLDAKMTLDFLDHLVALPYLFFQQRSAGDLMMRLQSNSTIREILTSGALSGVLDGAMVSFYLVLLLGSHFKIGLLVAFLGALNVAIFLAIRQRERDLMSQSLQAQAESRGYQVQMLAGMETLKVSGAEDRSVEHWSNLFVNELNVSLDRGRLDAIVESLLDTLRTASPLLVLLYGGLSVVRGELSLGTMLALNALAIGFLMPLSTLITTSLQLQLMGSYLDRISDVLETPKEQDRNQVRRLDELSGRIELSNVTFRYSPLSAPAVRDVSCGIEPGQLVAIVGASGSGKSTVASLLAGLYKPDDGRVLYDNVDLSELDLKWIRSRIGFVAQSSYLFGLTIRANIALSDPSSPFSNIIEAAQQACIHRDVTEMAMGYDSLLADGGASLSGGQRQRLALARALVSRPKILILDEATSALDAVTELQIQRNLAAMRCTRIVIAHRLSTIRHADVILVFDRGQIVESGTHSELVDKGGKYLELVSAQLEQEENPARQPTAHQSPS